MQIEEPVVDNQRSRFNFLTSIWIVPFIAAVIALWLVYEHYSKLGPEVKIYFKNSGGLVAGQSVVKFRDVPVGKVSRIEIDNKTEGVIVYARVNKDAEAFLNESTKFWVVKPEVDYSGVRGLDTLLSGSYIYMYAKRGKEKKREFVGLDNPFIDMNSGYYYVVKASFPVQVKVGTPLYFKGVKVGEIDNLELDIKSKDLIIVLRVYKEYGDLINSSSKFWIQSLMDLKLTENRLEVNIAPLPILLLGAIAFDTDFDKNYTKDFSKIYKLYRSATDAKEKKVGFAKPEFRDFVFNFRGDVSSLESDSAIKYKGFKIGELESLKIFYNAKLQNFEAECRGKIDLSNFSSNRNDGFKNFKSLVENGIVATLQKPNFLINKSIIELKETNSSNELKFNKKLRAYILPTEEYVNTNLLLTLKDISKKIGAIEFDKVVSNVNSLLEETKTPIKKLDALLANANKTVKSLERVISKREFQNIGKSVDRSLKDFDQSLKQLNSLLRSYGENSLFKEKLEGLLKEIHDLTSTTNELLYKLNKKPNSLIFGD